MKKSTVTRTDLLTVHLHDKQSLSKVEIKKIVIPQKGKTVMANAPIRSLFFISLKFILFYFSL